MLTLETLEALKTRKSIRRFQPTPIPEKDITVMLEAAVNAPSGGNQQPWKFIVVRSKKWKKDMADIIKDSCKTLPQLLEGVFENPHDVAKRMEKRFYVVSLFFVGAPVVVVVCVKQEDNPFLKCYTNQGLTYYEAFTKLGYIELLSASAAIENLLLAAHDLGYGACWMNIPFMAKDALEGLFNIEDPWEMLAMIPVGIPAHDPKKPGRTPVEKVTTFID